nr:D-glucuronyl C5-epimerase family protein [Geomicrobium halophilum]
MKPFKQTLVFWYKENSPFNSHSKDYYSALTQAYYTAVFAEMYEVTNDPKYKQAARQVYQSLKVPVAEGGVYHHSSKGPSIQEYPMAPNGYVLNGWFTALSSVKKYAETFKDPDANQFWRANLNTIIELLPLYDSPHLANSRYTLNGMATIKARFAKTDIELQQVKLHVPDEGSYTFSMAPGYTNYDHIIVDKSTAVIGDKIFTKNHNLLLKTLLSRYSLPKENELHLKLRSPRNTTMELFIVTPVYSPTPKMRKNTQHLLKTVKIKKGLNDIVVKMDWEGLEDVGQATTFKRFGSKWHNVYHFIHINRLQEFYEITGDERLLTYMNKWKNYVKQWPQIPLYNGLENEPY